eukprot:514186_1
MVMCSYLYKVPILIIVYCGITLPLVLIQLCIQLVIFIIRLPFYIYHHFQYYWCKNATDIPVKMDIITQTMYKGLYASGGGGDLIIYCTLYLNEDFSNTVNLLKIFETIRDFKRFRFVPHYSWLSGIYEFRKAENAIPEIQDHLHEYNEIKHSTLKCFVLIYVPFQLPLLSTDLQLYCTNL